MYYNFEELINSLPDFNYLFALFTNYLFVTLLSVFISIFFALMSMITVANAVIFQKANKPVWGSFIPFYSNYLFYDLAMDNGWIGLILIILSFITPFTPFLAGSVIAIINVVMYIYVNIQLAKKFNKSILFSIGLICLPIIFYPIIAFGNATYEMRK